MNKTRQGRQKGPQLKGERAKQARTRNWAKDERPKKAGINGMEAHGPKPNRVYKSRIFEMIFSDKRELLNLYNALNGTNYKNCEFLEINTLENAIYMSMRNDVSFLLDNRMSLYEHQATFSPNLPLRYLFYVSDLYCVQTMTDNLYGTRAVKIPAPRFVIFYNGEEERPDMEYLKLSDLYTVQDKECSLELTAVMLNINPGHNEELLI